MLAGQGRIQEIQKEGTDIFVWQECNLAPYPQHMNILRVLHNTTLTTVTFKKLLKNPSPPCLKSAHADPELISTFLTVPLTACKLLQSHQTQRQDFLSHDIIFHLVWLLSGLHFAVTGFLRTGHASFPRPSAFAARNKMKVPRTLYLWLDNTDPGKMSCLPIITARCTRLIVCPVLFLSRCVHI